MPEAVAAANPSPLAIGPAPAGKAPDSASSDTDRVTGAEGDSFSSALNKQMNPAQNAEKPAGKTAENGKTEQSASDAAQDEMENAAEAETISTDVIALLSNMLAGVAPPPHVVQALKEQAPADHVAGDSAQAIAAPITAAGLGQNVTPEFQGAETRQGGATAQTAQQLQATSANLAAPVETEAMDAGRKAGTQDHFDALLAAARELPANAGTANASHHAQAAKTELANAAAQVNTPVGAKGWANEVGEKLTWMVGNVNSKAELVLTPPQMGRIEVSLTVTGDQATATFVAANPAVREALENAVPRLREILQDAGINLGQAQVGAESSQQWAERGESGDNRARGLSGDGGDDLALGGGIPAEATWVRRGNGLVDTFA